MKYFTRISLWYQVNFFADINLREFGKKALNWKELQEM